MNQENLKNNGIRHLECERNLLIKKPNRVNIIAWIAIYIDKCSFIYLQYLVNELNLYILYIKIGYLQYYIKWIHGIK